MGYFSQKKKQKRINFFLAASIGFVALWLLLGQAAENTLWRSVAESYRFQVYIFTVFVFIAALLYRRGTWAVLALLLLIVNYTFLTSAANLFSNVSAPGKETLHIVFQPGNNGVTEILTAEPEAARRAGKIRLAPGREAFFVSLAAGSQVFTVISLDFPQLSFLEAPQIFDNLQKFVSEQDNPVIIVGDFGLPAWSPVFKKFLRHTGLEVKNRILMTGSTQKFSPLTVPSLNLLAFKNIGLKKIDLQSTENKPGIQIDFSLNFH